MYLQTGCMPLERHDYDHCFAWVSNSHIIPLSATPVARRARSRAASNTKYTASCIFLLELLDPFAQEHFSALLISFACGSVTITDTG